MSPAQLDALRAKIAAAQKAGQPVPVMTPELEAIAKLDPTMRVGGLRARVAPTVLSKLYRGGRMARYEVADWIKGKELGGKFI